MNKKILLDLINKGEGVTVEFKESYKELSVSGLETVVSFLNTIGGYLFLGIKDDGAIIGVNEEQISNIKINFSNIVNNKEKINPPIPLMLQELFIDKHIILYVYVPQSSEVHKLNNKLIFERTHEGDRDITNNTYAVKRLYARKLGNNTEDLIMHNITIEDFNFDTIDKARKLSKIYSLSNNWEHLSNKEILNQRCFYKLDKITGQYGYTLASLLLFGKKESIINEMPWYKVDVLKKVNDVDRYDDRFICEDNLIESYELLLKYMENNIEMPFYLNDGVTFNAIGVVIREVISNILIHREFMNNKPARIIIYKNKIVSENPNCPRYFGKLNEEFNDPFSKNSVIARTFRLIGYADEIGSGFKKIYHISNELFNTTPSILDTELFEIEIIYTSTDDENDISHEETIVKYIVNNGKITNKQCRELLNLERSRVINILNNLINKKVIIRSGQGKNTYYSLNPTK